MEQTSANKFSTYESGVALGKAIYKHYILGLLIKRNVRFSETKSIIDKCVADNKNVQNDLYSVTGNDIKNTVTHDAWEEPHDYMRDHAFMITTRVENAEVARKILTEIDSPNLKSITINSADFVYRAPRMNNTFVYNYPDKPTTTVHIPTAVANIAMAVITMLVVHDIDELSIAERRFSIRWININDTTGLTVTFECNYTGGVINDNKIGDANGAI